MTYYIRSKEPAFQCINVQKNETTFCQYCEHKRKVCLTYDPENNNLGDGNKTVAVF